MGVNMLYLTSEDVRGLGYNWLSNIELIKNVVKVINEGDIDQPIKPYLKFPDQDNRIIAMPARVGGEISVAGIKWVASFPKNHRIDKQRAHSTTILNNDQTGEPFAIFNSSLISAVRTASVSGLVIDEFDRIKKFDQVTLGIVGFGPIGQVHLLVATSLLKDRLKEVRIYDQRAVDLDKVPKEVRDKVVICNGWQEAFEPADIFITCTVSQKGYIEGKPKGGALLLDVSLRDFKPDILDYSPVIIVDNWEEVCRAGTDIEWMHKTKGLQKEDTFSIIDLVCSDKLKKLPENQSVMFHPMGMAVFDIAIALSYFKQAKENGVGLQL